MSHLIHHIAPEEIRSALSGFWNSVCEVQHSPQSTAISLPILMADGWQSVVFIEEEMHGVVTLRDRGKVHSLLSINGINDCNPSIRFLIDRALHDFSVQEDEKGFFKRTTMPLNATDIQLFGSFLSSISHLLYKAQKESIMQHKSWNTVVRCIKDRRIPFEQDVQYETPFRKISVELSARGTARTALLQTFDQKHKVDSLIELWGFRMKEISDSYDGVYKTALVYNESTSPDSSILKLTDKLCTLVCPSNKVDEIADFLKTVA